MTKNHNPTQYPIDEGVIKFNMHWTNEELEPNQLIEELLLSRNILKENNCIGAYAQDIGFGNVSIRREDSQQFYISGSQTGHIAIADKSHLSFVSQCSIEQNELYCTGQAKASSESLTHSMFYQLSTDIKAVVHIHHKELWERYLNVLPTSQKDIPYGTQQMANEIRRLFNSDQLADKKILVMAGHNEGLISFGQNLTEATDLFLNLLG